MPLPPTFIPIYTRQPQVDPIYRRYGLDELSSGISAGAALEYGRKFMPGQSLGRGLELQQARGEELAPALPELEQGRRNLEMLREQDAVERQLSGLPPIEPPSASEAFARRPTVSPRVMSPLLQPEELNKRYGVEGRLKFTEPEYEEAAEQLHEGAIEDVKRDDQLLRADQSLGAQAVRLGAGMIGSMLDPLGFAASVMPIIPEAMYASALAKAGGLGARAAARFKYGAVEGFVGTALLEPITYLGAKEEQADYGLWDSLANVAFGTVLGGGLHAGGGAVADAVGRMRWSERAEILKGAVGQFVDRGEVRVDAAVPAQTWRETMRAAEAAGEPAPLQVFTGKTTLGKQTDTPWGASFGSLSEGTSRQLMVDPNGGYFWGDYKEAAIRDGGVEKSGADKDATVALFGNGADARRAADATPQSKTSATAAPTGEVSAAATDPARSAAMADRSAAKSLLRQRAAGASDDEILALALATPGATPDTGVAARLRAVMALSPEDLATAAATPRPARAAPASAAPAAPVDRAAAVRASLAPSSETVADLHSAAVMADTVAKAPKADTAEQGIAAIQKDMATLDEQLQSIGPEVPERTTAEGEEAAPKYADWLDASDRAYLAEADDMIAQAAAKADVARVAALCGLGVG